MPAFFIVSNALCEHSEKELINECVLADGCLSFKFQKTII
jgi:hypothetical protein